MKNLLNIKQNLFDKRILGFFRESFISNIESLEVLKEFKLERNALEDEIKQGNKKPDIPFKNQSETEWDKWNKNQVDKIYLNGRVPKKNRVKEGGREFLLDEGQSFVLAQKNDTPRRILDSVRRLTPRGRDFSYLDPNASKYKSINIPANQVRESQWIPIPLKEEDRVLTNEQFLNYASTAIDEFLLPKNSRDLAYSKEVTAMVEKIGKEEIMCWAMAIAKQESGGAPLGQFVFHRWEKSHKAFSHSIFHVLMKGVGLKARENLGMTLGQMNHPKNAVKLFIAFMIEKHREMRPNTSSENTADFLQNKYNNLESFVVFYNGANWKKVNPDYLKNITKYRKEAEKTIKNPKSREFYEEQLAKRLKNKDRVNQTVEKRALILGSVIEKTIKLNEDKDDPKFPKEITESEKLELVESAEYLLRELSPADKSFMEEDLLQITTDEKCLYIRINRKFDEAFWGQAIIKREFPVNFKKEKELEKKEKSHEMTEKEYNELIEDNIMSRLRGNFWRSGEKNISIFGTSDAEEEKIVAQTISYLKRVAPDEKFNPELHEIVITSDEDKIYIKIKRKDGSLIGNGATTIKREQESTD